MLNKTGTKPPRRTKIVRRGPRQGPSHPSGQESSAGGPGREQGTKGTSERGRGRESGSGLFIEHKTIVRLEGEMIGKLRESFCGVFSAGCGVAAVVRG